MRRFGITAACRYLSKIAFGLVLLAPGLLAQLDCFLCEGNALTCENSNIQQRCTGPEIYCRLDVNAIAYPYIRQSCSPTCVETVSMDGISYTYCTRAPLGNCYRQQCNRVVYGRAESSRFRTGSNFPMILLGAVSVTSIAVAIVNKTNLLFR